MLGLVPKVALKTNSELLPGCSFVVPCLNEALSLRSILHEIESLRPLFHDFEIIVVDNGSSDGSIEQAIASSARVVDCGIRGYGAALNAGIVEARFPFIVFADADGTYAWRESICLLRSVVSGEADLVVGNRLQGAIEAGAMPSINRYFGTPALSFFITMFFGWKTRTWVRDCNAGLRAFRKADFLSWNPRARGMEFASEMIIRALLNNARYLEKPISYRRAMPGRISHLRRWRDGLRHLRVVFDFALRRNP